MNEQIDWDERLQMLTDATRDDRLSKDTRVALTAFLKEIDAFNAVAIPDGGFDDEGETNDVLGPADEGEIEVVSTLQRVIDGKATEADLLKSIGACRELHARGLAKAKKEH